MSATHVDLSLAKPGDQCHLRDGCVVPFAGANPYCPEGRFPYWAGEQSYKRNGEWGDSGVFDSIDIVRVTRDGKVITPAPAYPNAGPGCDLSRYRTGEVPQVGDVVQVHSEPVCGLGIRNTCGGPFTVAGFPAFSGKTELMLDGVGGPFIIARFDLLSRAPAKPAEEVGEKLSTVGYGIRVADDGYGKPILPLKVFGRLDEAKAFLAESGDGNSEDRVVVVRVCETDLPVPESPPPRVQPAAE